MSRDGNGQSVDDAGVDVEKVVAGHSRFAGDACGDDDEVRAGEGGGELVGARVAGDLKVKEGKKKERGGRG